MGINDRMIFTTPSADDMFVAKERIADTTCPECGGSDILRYPIGWYMGPRMVVKCQDCFHSLAVERPKLEDNWPAFRSATYDWAPSRAERPAGAPKGSEG